MTEKKPKPTLRIFKGSDKSGHYDHAGRPGQKGGSAPSGSGSGDPSFDRRSGPEKRAEREAKPSSQVQEGSSESDDIKLLRPGHVYPVKSKYGEGITVRISASGKSAKVSVGGRKPLTYKMNKDGKMVRQGQYIKVSNGEIEIVDL